MVSNFIQPFKLKGGDSENDQLDYNGPNAALNAVYNSKRGEWIERVVSKKITPPRINTVLVPIRGGYKLNEGQIIV